MRPELLAVRAVNQYRRRDVLAYLGLRYYLRNSCAQADKWARDVSSHLVCTRISPIYLRSFHFKEMGENEIVIHRNLYLPGPNEAYAEAMLLNECSSYPAFRSSDCVYSYQFPSSRVKEGIFRNYFPGYQERHRSIASYCNDLKDAKVLYTDIKKFYPSIRKELALQVWSSACDSSGISPKIRELGERLLSDQNLASVTYQEGLGLLTGPMFTHMIANLVLAEIDKAMSEKMDGRYWRYVDDMVLVGNDDEIKTGREILSSMLKDLGFSLHDEGKDFTVDGAVWLDGVNDFDESDGKTWISLIGNIKRFLVAQPEKRDELIDIFSANGINIPLLDYSNAVKESTYLDKLSDWLRFRWAAKSMRGLTINMLVRDAIQAREIYQRGMNILLDKNPDIKGYERKRLIPKLRFYAGRLIYLATPDSLLTIGTALVNYPELRLQAEVMKAIQSKDISSLLKFGANAVQAAAQILRIRDEAVNCTLDTFNEVDLQGLAILRLNGVKVDFLGEDVLGKTINDPLNQFALGYNLAKLMKSDDPFIKEIACLCGAEGLVSHKVILDTAFDRDEHLIFDIINQLNESSYF
jgi:hypothetical protein